MTLPEIVSQLEWCGYECVGGPLQNNVAFIELKKLSERSQSLSGDSKPVVSVPPLGESDWTDEQEIALGNVYDTMIAIIPMIPIRKQLEYLSQRLGESPAPSGDVEEKNLAKPKVNPQGLQREDSTP